MTTDRMTAFDPYGSKGTSVAFSGEFASSSAGTISSSFRRTPMPMSSSASAQQTTEFERTPLPFQANGAHHG